MEEERRERGRERKDELPLPPNTWRVRELAELPQQVFVYSRCRLRWDRPSTLPLARRVLRVSPLPLTYSALAFVHGVVVHLRSPARRDSLRRRETPVPPHFDAR